MFCSYGGHVPAAELLLARGANIHYESDLALYYAAFGGQLEMVAFLLDNSADLHAGNDGGMAHFIWHGSEAMLRSRRCCWSELRFDLR